VKSLLVNLEGKLKGQDFQGVEQELTKGLDELRRTRKVEAPAPYAMEDLMEDLRFIRDGLKTGYDALDEKLRIPQGAITVIAGRPGHGKTTFMLNLFLHLTKAQKDRRHYFFSYEEARSKLAIKILEIMAGEVLSKEFNMEAYIHYLREKRHREPNQKIERALREYTDLTSSGRLWLLDSRLPAEDLASLIGSLTGHGGTGAVIVDYFQKIPLKEYRRSQELRYLELKQVSAILLEQAVSLDIPVIVGAQFNRAGEEMENIREGADITQDANLVLRVGPPEEDGRPVDSWKSKEREVPFKVNVLKNRAGAADIAASLVFDRQSLRIKSQESGRM
jgi:replicative DNA helicase